MKKRNILILKIFIIISSLEAVPAEKINRIEHLGLDKTRKETVECRIKNREGCEYSEELWEEEKATLMDLDIFADVQVRIEKCEEGTNLLYCYKELPSYIVYPAMKRTDQDGLMVGPGVTFMNIAGLGIHEEIISRYTVAPELLRAKEVLSYTRIPKLGGIPFTAEVTLSYFESYNALKIYDENSSYSQADIYYRPDRIYTIVATASALYVKHDESNPMFTEVSRDIPMFYGNGDWDYLPSAGAGFIIDTRDRKMNPHSGIFNEYRATLYGDKLGGDSDFTEYIFDFRGYIPAGESHIFHVNFLGRYRPGTIPGYELYHVGGVNSLRVYEPDPSMCGQHETLGTVEYRYELFTNRQVSLWDMHGYYGLQFVAGMDNAVQWIEGDRYNKGTYYNSFYAGVHLLVPVLERVRFEFGYSGFENDRYNFRFGANMGWYEKAHAQRRRVR